MSPTLGMRLKSFERMDSFPKLRANARILDQKVKLKQQWLFSSILSVLRRSQHLSRDCLEWVLDDNQELRYALAYALFQVGEHRRAEGHLQKLTEPALFARAGSYVRRWQIADGQTCDLLCTHSSDRIVNAAFGEGLRVYVFDGDQGHVPESSVPVTINGQLVGQITLTGGSTFASPRTGPTACGDTRAWFTGECIAHRTRW